jgi:signal transduction histidine kinase
MARRPSARSQTVWRLLGDGVATVRHLALPRLRRQWRLPETMARLTRWIRARWPAHPPLGFAARLGLATSALILVTCIAEAWILARGELEHVRQYLTDRGRAISEELAREAGAGVAAGNAQGLRQLAEQTRVQRGVAYTRVFDRQGLLLVSVGTLPAGLTHPQVTFGRQSVGPLPVDSELWEFHAPVFAPEKPLGRPNALQSGGRGALAQLARIEPIGTVAIGLRLEPLTALRRRTVTTGTLFTALFTVAAVLSALALARAITRPLKALATAADRIARGDLGATVEVATRDEIGDLGRSFNAMVDSLGRSRAMLESYSRALEEKVEELQKANHLKSEFMATISHELRTPLNVIIGYTEMLLEGAGGPVSESQTGMLRAVQEYSQAQLALITNVLDFSRLSSGRVSFKVERFELEPLLREVMDAYASRVEARPLRLTVSVAPDVPALETDRGKLEEIVRSLVDNAVKFTDRGSVSLVATCGRDPDSVAIEVTDTGPGIAAEEVSCLFDPFRQIGQSSTRRTGGLGLGLSIVRHLVDALRGTVSVSSRMGEGSTFRIEVPCSLQDEAATPETETPEIAVAALDVVSRNSGAVPAHTGPRDVSRPRLARTAK